eukprot:3704936-Rhodomonas_salina.3
MLRHYRTPQVPYASAVPRIACHMLCHYCTRHAPYASAVYHIVYSITALHAMRNNSTGHRIPRQVIRHVCTGHRLPWDRSRRKPSSSSPGTTHAGLSTNEAYVDTLRYEVPGTTYADRRKATRSLTRQVDIRTRMVHRVWANIKQPICTHSGPRDGTFATNSSTSPLADPTCIRSLSTGHRTAGA